MKANELVIDSFAGGGGASTGIERALGRPVDVAVNHNPAAIEMHRVNHPATRHLTEDVFRVNPRAVTGGRPVGLLWASPDCRHFSRAKGGKPVEKSIRGLAWVVVKWATEVAPRVIILENVREFQDWGPLLPRWDCPGCRWKGTEGQARLLRRRPACPACDSTRLVRTEFLVPDPARKGITFRQFVGRLKARGYAVEWKVLDAADYGAPTHRRRLFLVARNDGEPVRWPEPTHGDPKKVGRDLFSQDLLPWRSAAECIDWAVPCPSIFDRKVPLRPNTLRRIAMGVKRYVLDNPRPFVVDMQRENRPLATDEPLGTVTTQSNRYNLVTPVLSQYYGDSPASRAKPVAEPLPTVVQTANGAQLVAAFVAKHFGGVVGCPADAPIRTVTSGGCHAALVYSFLVKYFGTAVGQHVADPLHTVTGKDRFGLVTVSIDGEPYVITDIGMRMLKPRELARAQGFPEGYALTGSSTNQVERIGNSVCPPVAEAMVRANCVAAAEAVAA